MIARLSWASLTVKKGFVRRAVARLAEWALREEMDETRANLDILHRWVDGNRDINARFNAEQFRLREVHADWIIECRRQQDRHEASLAEMKRQNEIFEQALLFARNGR